MKKTKRFLALIMMMILSLSLVGCGDDSADLYGKWERNFDITQAMMEGAGDEYADFNEQIELKVILEFKEDGSYSMYADEETTTANFDQWVNALAAYETEMIYSSYEEQGYTRAEVDEQAQQQYGSTMEEYVLETEKENFDVETLMSSLGSVGVYEAKNGKLYMADTEILPNQYDLYTLEGDTLTIEAATEEIEAEAAEVPGFEYPWIFTKVAE